MCAVSKKDYKRACIYRLQITDLSTVVVGATLPEHASSDIFNTDYLREYGAKCLG